MQACQDIDECSLANNTCSQFCRNLDVRQDHRPYECGCAPNYEHAKLPLGSSQVVGSHCRAKGWFIAPIPDMIIIVK